MSRPIAACFALALLAGSAAAAAPDGGSAPLAPALFAANAAAYLRFRNAAALTRQRLDEMRVTMALLAGREGVRKALGADVLDLVALGAAATDPQREIFVDWGIAEPPEVEAIRAAAAPPVGGFTIQFAVTLPVSDPQEAPPGLAQLLAVPACAPVSADRKHPAAPDRVVYRCATERAALSVRLDRNRRELRLIVALGSRAAAAVAAPIKAAPPALSARLLGEGFFDSEAAFFTTPADLVRGGIAMGLTQMLAVFSEMAVEPTAKRAIWQQGVKELGSIARLADSGPRMFSSLLVTERSRQWDLTSEGETLLASLGLPRVLDAKLAARLPDALGRHMKLDGPFGGDTAELTRTVMEAGQLGYVIIDELVWPHVLAFSAQHPELKLPSTPPSASRIELDRLHHRLVLTRP